MLTINDLSVTDHLDSAAMRGVRGGYYLPTVPSTFFGYTNAPKIDAGFHELVQGQSLAVNQAGSVGGFNVVDADQHQVGVSGQVAF
jgi:hypothetical protein